MTGFRDGLLAWTIPAGTWGGTRVRVSVLIPLAGLAACVRTGDVACGVLTAAALLGFAAALAVGRCAAAAAAGEPVAGVLLWPLGSVEVGPDVPARGWREHAAGPACEALAAGAGFLALRLFEVPVRPWEEPGPVRSVADAGGVVLLCGGVVTLAQLLPAWPLAAGAALRDAVAGRHGRRAGAFAAVAAARAVGLVALVLAAAFGRAWAAAAAACVLLLTREIEPPPRVRAGRPDDTFLGYDFSEGYTSLERGGREEEDEDSPEADGEPAPRERSGRRVPDALAAGAGGEAGAAGGGPGRRRRGGRGPAAGEDLRDRGGQSDPRRTPRPPPRRRPLPHPPAGLTSYFRETAGPSGDASRPQRAGGMNRATGAAAGSGGVAEPSAAAGGAGRGQGGRHSPRSSRTPMPVLDPAPPPVRAARRAAPAVADALARHAERTGLPLADRLRADPAAEVPPAPVVTPAAPGVLSVALPLAAGGVATGLLPETAAGDPAAAVSRLLAASAGWEAAAARADGLEDELDDVTEQLTRGFEELALYHRLTGRMRASRDARGFAAECLDDLLATSGADAAAVRVRLPGGDGLLTAGVPLFNAVTLRRLTRAAAGHDFARPLVANGPACGLRGACAAALVPVRSGADDFGWIALANAAPDAGRSGEELGSPEGSLLAVVAAALGTHLRNAALFREKEQMLLEFVLGLVHTLDARDPYTRGHSERVAVVAHRLARELGLTGPELDNVHLAGLLHDIGKVGVDDGVLRKPGKLTDAEFDQIKRHPTIGFEILRGISGLADILPGVRSHHENFDGTGYPDRLAGGDIPLMARVMAVADSYDAMGSDRPYRDGMPVAKIEAIFAGGRGTQWDPRVLDAYDACAADVRRIWNDPGDTAGLLQARAVRREADAGVAPAAAMTYRGVPTGRRDGSESIPGGHGVLPAVAGPGERRYRGVRY